MSLKIWVSGRFESVFQSPGLLGLNIFEIYAFSESVFQSPGLIGLNIFEIHAFSGIKFPKDCVIYEQHYLFINGIFVDKNFKINTKQTS